MGKERLEAVIKEDADLLASFGLRLLSVSGGIRAAVESELNGDRVNPWNVLEISDKTWNWLRPILVEFDEAKRTDMADVIRLAAN
jgi:hypothetical protein